MHLLTVCVSSLARSLPPSSGLRKSPELSPRRLSDISPQLRQLKFLAVEESIKEELKVSRSVEDINSVSIEERILRITGYYGYHPWNTLYTGENATVPDRREVGGSGAETRGVSQKLRHCAREAAVHAWEVLWGVAMMLCVCLSWVGATQLAKVTFRKVNAPFALTWFASTWNIFFFPLYYLGHLCKGGERQTPRQCYRECSRFFGAAGLTVKAFLLKVAPFGVLWTLSTYLYLQALRRIPSTDAAALFCCSKAFVFLLSWIVLRDRFLGVRVRPSGSQYHLGCTTYTSEASHCDSPNHKLPFVKYEAPSSGRQRYGQITACCGENKNYMLAPHH
uniref:Solute carrier family 35 member F3 n=1 Tax=Scleropages formosus TaxID=113540 RepID=A0A8C9SBW6_SCLFO